MGEMHVERDGYCGMANVGLGESNLAVVVPAGSARAMAGDPAGFLDQWVARHPQLRRRFRRARRLGRALVTGPFAHHARRAWAPGAALVGDAADYFDPFTGEGIYAALRGAELLAPAALAALGAPSTRAADRALASYHAARRRAFVGRWVVERLIATTVAWPPLIERAAAVLERRRDMADLLVGVTGDFVPARQVLRPGFLYTLFLHPRRFA
jgi:flavin-dependent dehydrogenase